VLPLLVAAALAFVASAETAAPEPEATFSRTLYLIRHGAYDTSQKTDSEAGPGLTALGIAQARLVAARLRGMPVHFSLMTSSKMTRAQETAAVIHETLPEVPMTQSDSLRECTPPMRDEKKPDERRGKEERECEATLDQAFAQYFTPAQHVGESDVLVAHGNVIRYLVARALGVDTSSWNGMAVAHASLTVIRVRPNGAMVVLSVGDVGHLPPNVQSWGSAADPQLVAPRTSPSRQTRE
jgi:serine/threonine-protein phosphatase PGAM5